MISQMFLSYMTVRIDRDQAASTAAAYLAQIKHLPLWAIQIGCQSCIARNNPFPPSAGELRAACERAVQPLRDEEAAICKVLEADVYHQTADGRKLSDRCRNAIAELVEANSMEKAKRKRQLKEPINGSVTQLSDGALELFNRKAPAPDMPV